MTYVIWLVVRITSNPCHSLLTLFSVCSFEKQKGKQNDSTSYFYIFPSFLRYGFACLLHLIISLTYWKSFFFFLPKCIICIRDRDAAWSIQCMTISLWIQITKGWNWLSCLCYYSIKGRWQLISCADVWIGTNGAWWIL